MGFEEADHRRQQGPLSQAQAQILGRQAGQSEQPLRPRLPPSPSYPRSAFPMPASFPTLRLLEAA